MLGSFQFEPIFRVALLQDCCGPSRIALHLQSKDDLVMVGVARLARHSPEAMARGRQRKHPGFRHDPILDCFGALLRLAMTGASAKPSRHNSAAPHGSNIILPDGGRFAA
jgi:hypothetical protein